MKSKENTKMRKKQVLKWLISFGAILFWIAVWLLISLLVNNDLLIPGPLPVFKRLFELASDKTFYKVLIYSLSRVMCGIFVSVIIGVMLAVLTKKFIIIDEIMKPMMTLIKSTPVSSFILLALVFINRSAIPVFIVFLIVLPIIWGNVSEGISNIDKNLNQMLKLYKVGFFKKLIKFYIPSIMPYFKSALISSSGLAFKAGIAAEVLCVPLFAIGKMLFESKQYLETIDLFAWTLTVIILSLVIEKLLKLFTRRKAQGVKRRHEC